MITILRPSTYLQPNFKATAIDLHSELLDHFGLSAAVRSVAAFCLSDTTALGMDGPERTFVDGAANDSSEPSLRDAAICTKVLKLLPSSHSTIVFAFSQ